MNESQCENLDTLGVNEEKVNKEICKSKIEEFKINQIQKQPVENSIVVNNQQSEKNLENKLHPKSENTKQTDQEDNQQDVQTEPTSSKANKAAEPAKNENIPTNKRMKSTDFNDKLSANISKPLQINSNNIGNSNNENEKLKGQSYNKSNQPEKRINEELYNNNNNNHKQYLNLALETIQSEDVEDNHNSLNKSCIGDSMRIHSDLSKTFSEHNEHSIKESELVRKQNRDALMRFSADFAIQGINLPTKGGPIIKVNITPRGKVKAKNKYGNFVEETGSIYSSSMPPSDLGDKVVNISAIEIDKNDMSFYVSDRKEENNEDKELLIRYRRQQIRAVLNFVISVILLAAMIFGIYYFLIS